MRCKRLPRTRGDRPYISNSTTKRQKATPHTRGSTLAGRNAILNIKGYPAHAGIDRISLAVYVEQLATPHTRGSTHMFAFWNTPPLGYPAHAGIDL